jgi:hypothetical protein
MQADDYVTGVVETSKHDDLVNNTHTHFVACSRENFLEVLQKNKNQAPCSITSLLIGKDDDEKPYVCRNCCSP